MKYLLPISLALGMLSAQATVPGEAGKDKPNAVIEKAVEVS